MHQLKSYIKIGLALLALLTTAVVQSADIYLLHSALNYNFAKFAQWPGNTDSQLQLCYFNNQYAQSFERFNGKRVGGKEVVTLKLDSVSEASQCQLVFIDRRNRDLLNRLFLELRGKPVLTVSDIAGFHEEGGMIELTRVDNKLRFLINLKSVNASKLTISSQLLKLALDVKR